MIDITPDGSLQYEVTGRLAHLWLNRPEKRNSLTEEMVAGVATAAKKAEDDPEVRVLIVRGRGGNFCTGYDLGALQSDVLGTANSLEVPYRVSHTFDTVWNLRKPVVAVLEGHTAAGGFELMLNCDFVVAATDARIGDVHIRRGLFGGAGPLYRLPRIVGLRRSKELMMTGKQISGEQAVDWGLANAAFEPDQLDAGVEEFVRSLADKSGFALWITKMTLNKSLDADSDSLMVMEHLAAAICMQSDDAAEGVRAFLEKRQPNWA